MKLVFRKLGLVVFLFVFFALPHFASAANLYFNAAVDSDWGNVLNWWSDDGYTIPAGAVPTSADDAYVSASVTSNSGDPASVNALHVSGSNVNFAIDVTVAAGATFGDSSYHGSASTLTGSATFNGTSFADGTFIGDVTLNTTLYSGSAPTGGILTVGAGHYWSGNVSGVIYGVDSQPITTWIFTGDAQNYDTVSGNAEFHGASQNNGTVTGDACFASSATNSGTVTGTVSVCTSTLYFYSTSDTDWNNVANWYEDSDHTIPASNIPDIDTTAYVVDGSVRPLADFDTWNNVSYIDAGTVGVSFTSASGAALGGGSTTGDVAFYGNSSNGGDLNGNAEFHDQSYNGSGFTVSGDATFSDSSHNDGQVSGAAYFYGSSYMGQNGSTVDAHFHTDYYGAVPTGGVFAISQNVYLGEVDGVAYDSGGQPITRFEFIGGASTDANIYHVDTYFYNSSHNDGYINGVAHFYDTSYNVSQIDSTAAFRGSSQNQSGGTVSGNACFAATAANSGTVSGTVSVCLTTLYFNAAADNDWANLANWWEDDAFIAPASALPTSIDDAYISASVTSNSGAPASVNALDVSGSSSLGIDITVAAGASFRGSVTNAGAITGDADVYSPVARPLGGSVSGTITYHGYDDTAPVVSISAPADGGTVSSWAPSVSWDDADACAYQLDGGSFATLDCVQNGSDISAPAEGSHELVIRGLDTALNAGYATSTFTYTLPVVPAVPSSGGHSSGGGSRIVFVTPVAPVTPDMGCTAGNLFSTTTGKKCTQATPDASPTNFTKNLKFGSLDSDVKLLQIFLNTHGFPVALSGAGSSGKETNYFGPATRYALIKFQLANSIKPAVGFFGPITQKIVNAK